MAAPQGEFALFSAISIYESPAPLREWFDLLLEVALEPKTGLFAEYDGILKIHPDSSNVPNYLEYFKFIGRIHSIAIRLGFLIDSKFVPLIYPLLTERPEERNVEKLISDAMDDPTAKW